jgi:hypothetical protein
MQTGSSETLIGWKSGQTPLMSLYVGPNGESVAMDSGKIMWNPKAVSFRPGAQESFAKEKASFCSFTRDLLTRPPDL